MHVSDRRHPQLPRHTHRKQEHKINLMWQAHNNLIDSYFVWLAIRRLAHFNRTQSNHWKELIFAATHKKTREKILKNEVAKWNKLIIQSIEAYLGTTSITQVAVWLESSDKNVIMNKEWCHFVVWRVFRKHLGAMHVPGLLCARAWYPGRHVARVGHCRELAHPICIIFRGAVLFLSRPDGVNANRRCHTSACSMWFWIY